MDNLDQLIAKFKAVKEELLKSKQEVNGYSFTHHEDGEDDEGRPLRQMKAFHDGKHIGNIKAMHEAGIHQIHSHDLPKEHAGPALKALDYTGPSSHIKAETTEKAEGSPEHEAQEMEAVKEIDKEVGKLKDMHKSDSKGVHTSGNPATPGRSTMGIMARLGETEAAKVQAKNTLKEMKKLPKPKLTKDEGPMEALECSANGQWNIVEKSLDPSKYSWKHVGSDSKNHNYSVHYADKKVGDLHVERNAKPGDRVAGGNWGVAHNKNIDHVTSQVEQHAASIDKPRLVESKKN
jgi:hypothetical protein